MYRFINNKLWQVLKIQKWIFADLQAKMHFLRKKFKKVAINSSNDFCTNDGDREIPGYPITG